MENKKMTIEYVIEHSKILEKEINDLEESLRKLRKDKVIKLMNHSEKNDWLINIESDKRISVELLYKEYKSKKEKYNNFIKKIIVEID